MIIVAKHDEDGVWYVLQGVESSAIIWGVGSESLHLPVPSTCPEGLQILLRQCWYVCWIVFTVYVLCLHVGSLLPVETK